MRGKGLINVGLIGTGRLGNMYAKFLSHRVYRSNLIAVADIISERASTCAEKFGVKKWYDNHHDLNADPEVDAVIVTATTTNHKEIVIDAAQQGKPTFCEKPITLNIDDAKEMKKAVEESGIYFQMGFQRRFDKGFSATKKKIEEGIIGTPVVFRGSSRDPFPPSLEYLKPENSGGQIIDMAIHDFDIARWYMGNVKTVYAIGGVLAYPEIKKVNDIDNAIISMVFENGCLGEIDVSRNGIYGYDIRAEVLGTKGAIKAGYLRETPILIMNKKGVTYDVVPYFPERFAEAYIRQLNNYLENLSQDREPDIKIYDGIAALQIAVAATVSQKENKIMNVQNF